MGYRTERVRVLRRLSVLLVTVLATVFASAAPVAAAAPDAPVVTATAVGSDQVDVSWTVPAANGTTITGYAVTLDPGGLTFAASDVETSHSFTALDPGITYTATVVAESNDEDSPAGTDTATTAATAPGAPTGVTATATGTSTASVSWTAPASDGGSAITGYTVTASPGGQTATTTGATTVTVSGLTASTEYTFSVVATNVVNDGPASSASNQITTDDPPATAPGAPTGVTATATGTSTASVSWTAPASDGGSAITGYTVTASPGNRTATTTGATSATVTGLSAATDYTFTVVATNVVNDGPASSASNQITTDGIAPSPFTITPTIASATSVDLTWTDAGGAPAPVYDVTISPTGPSASAPSGRTSTVSGMTPGVDYTVTVTATNDTGVRTATATISADAKPSAPTGVTGTVVFDPLAVHVSWNDPANAGTDVTMFKIGISKDGVALAPIEIEPGEADESGGVWTYMIPSTLDRGDYVFTVAASNDAGYGATSSASSSVEVPTSPGPTSITVQSLTRYDNGTFSPLPYGPYVAISWEPPEDTGGLPITHYTVSMAGLTAPDVTATTATIGPLAPGTYFAEITAHTAAGSTTALSGQVVVKEFAPFDSRSEFVTQQYADFLGRTPDAGGLSFYVGATNSDGTNAAYLIATFMDSPEFAPRRSIVRLYQAYFGRMPDKSGFDFWAGRLASGASSLGHASASFAASDEFFREYGTLTNLEFVDRVYLNVLGRLPDAGGRAFWVAQLDAGMDRGTMMTNFSESPEYIAITAAHVDVVMTYRGMLGRMPDAGGYAFWVETVDGNRAQLLALIQQFFVSSEYAERVNG